MSFPPSHLLVFPFSYPENPSIPDEASRLRSPDRSGLRSLSILIQTTPTLHSAGVLFLDQSPFYRHYAPLERKGILLSRPSINMPPLWGSKTFGHSVFSKHVAPLSRFPVFLPSSRLESC